jgi:Protein of unknown function (DUF2523)
VLLSLGFGVVAFVGLDLALSALLSQAKAAWAGSLSADVAAYVAMSGANTGLSMIAGAMVGRVAMMATKSLRLL